MKSKDATTCNGCKFAEWDRTEKGRLHPRKSGWCRYQYVPAPLPASMYLVNSNHVCGGHIRRDEPFSNGRTCPVKEVEK